MSSQYPHSGALFTSAQKRNDRAPDMFGNLEVEKDYLLALIDKAAGAPFVTIKLDGWMKKDKNDKKGKKGKKDIKGPQETRKAKPSFSKKTNTDAHY
jgi:hypothetical protein